MVMQLTLRGGGMSSEVTRLTLADVCSDVSYGYTESATTEQVGPKFLRITDIQGGTFDWRKVPYCPASEQDSKKYQLEVGDIVVARTGNSTGENAQVLLPPPPAIFASYLIRFRPDPRRVNPFFVGYQLRSERFRQHVLSVRSGSAQPGANAKQLGAFPVQLIDRTQQDAAVDTLRALDDRITLLRETNATLEAIAQALFKSWFVDFDPVHAQMEGRTPEGMDEATAALFPDGFEASELGVVPRGWRWGTFSDLATFQNGYAFKSKDWTDCGHPVIKIGDVKPGIIDLEGCSYVAHETVVGLDRFRLSRGDLLVGMTGYVGETGLVPSVEPAAYLNQRVGRMATKLGVADLGYLYCAARSPAFKEFAEAQSHGSAQANVSGASLMAFPTVIAPLPLMERFNGAIADVLEVVLTNHEQAQTLSTLRDTLLPRLISGQLRLPETENLVKALIF